MKNECAICKAADTENATGLIRERIYKKYRYHEFWLCYKHSVEFFKLGQEQFILKYPSIARDNDWKDEGESKKTAFYF